MEYDSAATELTPVADTFATGVSGIEMMGKNARITFYVDQPVNRGVVLIVRADRGQQTHCRNRLYTRLARHHHEGDMASPDAYSAFGSRDGKPDWSSLICLYARGSARQRVDGFTTPPRWPAPASSPLALPRQRFHRKFFELCLCQSRKFPCTNP